MTYLLDHPSQLLLLLLFILILYNWPWLLAVYRDAKQRNIRHKLFWSFFVFFTAGWGMPFYDAWTERPQTLLSSIPMEMIIGKSATKTQRRIQSALMILFLIIPLFSLLKIFTSYQNLKNALGDNNALNLILYGFILPTLIVVYLYFASKSNTINPLDKPLWGMKLTPQGAVDVSLTKHKKAVIVLVCFILSLPFLFILYILISTKLGY